MMMPGMLDAAAAKSRCSLCSGTYRVTANAGHPGQHRAPYVPRGSHLNLDGALSKAFSAVPSMSLLSIRSRSPLFVGLHVPILCLARNLLTPRRAVYLPGPGKEKRTRFGRARLCMNGDEHEIAI